MTKKNYPKLSLFISEHYPSAEAAKIRADAQEEFAQLQAVHEDVEIKPKATQRDGDHGQKSDPMKRKRIT
jgi:hypothetical protein